MNKCKIRNETPADYLEVEELTRKAFWNVYRPGCLEDYVLHCFRADPDFVTELDFVLEREGKIIGHVMFARAKIAKDDGGKIPIMTFGPISIDPEFQRRGFGKYLLEYAMERALSRYAGTSTFTANADLSAARKRASVTPTIRMRIISSSRNSPTDFYRTSTVLSASRKGIS